MTRAGRTVVQVCFPSYAVLSLNDLVPDDVRVRIVAEHVDLEMVAADAAVARLSRRRAVRRQRRASTPSAPGWTERSAAADG